MERYMGEVGKLSEAECRRFLVLLLTQSAGQEPGAVDVLGLWQPYQEACDRENRLRLERERFTHVLFSPSDAGLMKVAISRLGKRPESRVLASGELLSVGPLRNLEQGDGRIARFEWFSARYAEFPYAAFGQEEYGVIHWAEELRRIPAHHAVVLWGGENAHDQMGVRLALHLLRERTGPVHLVNVSEAYARTAERYDPELHPLTAGELPMEAVQELLLQGPGEPLSPEARAQYAAQWLELSEDPHPLRIWRDGRIVPVEEDYFDGPLLEIVKELELQAAEAEDGFVRAGQAVGTAIVRWRQVVGDGFVNYRLLSLISAGRLEFQGLPSAMFRYRVRVRE
ncbi:DUF1835 domain-containing protein [Paenibacillus sp. S-38]|uniref:DUF1835 domain-containing protein n=1 Tax=Paenibacillus sp. S-38 TaxID=3416710 RepID=UPI003CF0306B